MPVDAHLRETMRLPSTIGGNLSAGGGLMRPWLQGVERGEGKLLRPLCVPSTSRRPPVVADQALARLHIIKRDAHAVPRHEISFVSVQWTSIVSLQAPGRGLIECLTVTGVGSDLGSLKCLASTLDDACVSDLMGRERSFLASSRKFG